MSIALDVRAQRQQAQKQRSSLMFGGTIAALILLFILVNGILDRWAKPLVEWLKA